MHDGRGPEGLSGRVALVTGGSGGIGRAIALALAGAGVSVAIGYGASDATAQQLAGQITAAGGRAAALSADLAYAAEVARLAEDTEHVFGPVDILVNNAGTAERRQLENIEVEEFDETVAVNLRAPFLLAQRLVPSMAQRGFGRVLFMSSVAAFTGGIVGPHYAAAKAGLHGLTHSLAARFAAAGVTVNAIAPALITDTGMFPGDPEELRRQVPVGRLGRPAEVADLALAVLGNPYLTNQVISLDGGVYPR
ncbi:MAG TPA: SDR family NAD(P)-dependent oxidoreductase [Streptosporangiaceae bacterium]|nr:SDR family NAD(P)-dependent oxidoreductase [Streptosporangiaceae bacterium]